MLWKSSVEIGAIQIYKFPLNNNFKKFKFYFYLQKQNLARFFKFFSLNKSLKEQKRFKDIFFQDS